MSTQLRFNDLPNLVTRAILFVLAFMQCWLAWEFWQSYATDGPARVVLPVAGAGLALLEVFALVVAADADADTKKTRGRGLVWRMVWIVLLSVNLLTEIGAFASIIAAEEGERAAVITRATDLETQRDTLDREIASLTAELAARNADKPIAALQVELDAAHTVAAGFAEMRPRDAREIARLESAIITARARETAEASRASLQAQIGAEGATPSEYHPQLIAIATILNGAGLRSVAPSDIKAFLPLALALVLKLVLTFGFWVTARDRQSSAIVVEDVPVSPSAVPPLPPPPPLEAVVEPQVVEEPTPKPRRRRKRKGLNAPPPEGELEPWNFVFDDEDSPQVRQ